MPTQLLTDKQLAYAKHGTDADGIRTANASNYEDALDTNLNTGLPPLLANFPHLVEYIDRERLQDAVTGGEIGLAFGELLTREQHQRMIAAGLWQEQRPDETDAAFLDRIGDLREQYLSDITQTLGAVDRASAAHEFLQAISDRIIERVQAHIEHEQATTDITTAVPTQAVIEWARTHHEPTSPPGLPALLDELYSDWDDGVEAKFLAVRTILVSIGLREDVASVREEEPDSVEEQWRHGVFPSEEDIEQYTSVIDALDADIHSMVTAYFEDKQITETDRVLMQAVAVLDGVSRPAKDLLNGLELHQYGAAWQGHHTRVANRWTQHDPPILTQTAESDGRHEWAWTPFGQLVKALWESDADRETIEQSGIPAGIPNDIIATAIDYVQRRRQERL